MSEQEKTAARYFEKFRKSLRVGATVFGIGGLAATGVGVYTLEYTLSGTATKKLEQLAPNLRMAKQKNPGSQRKKYRQRKHCSGIRPCSAWYFGYCV